MSAVKTSLPYLNLDGLKKILGGSKKNKGGIRSAIPVGFKRHSKKQDEGLMPAIDKTDGFLNLPIVNQNYESALKQLGTLGSGNHFIEIQRGSDGHIWAMVHSGSRNIGLKVANHYNKLSVSLNKKWYSSVPKKWELAFLPLDSDEGCRYIEEMKWCVEFAKANRNLMMERIEESILAAFPDTEFDQRLDVSHNYAVQEHHFRENVWVHRKGAIRLREGDIGIIPGSQGTKSYIVEGKGNADSFNSASHGAGRLMSRKKAIENLSLEEEKERLNYLGILHSVRSKKDLDEAPSAYKDIKQVIADQADILKVKVELIPLAVVKG